MSNTCNKSPFAKASKNEFGMIPRTWATMPSSFARVT